MRVLIVNAGSSSLKLRLLDDEDRILADRELAAPAARVDAAELSAAMEGDFAGSDVVVHRIVHGGERFRDAVLIDPSVEQALRELTALAPLHQPKSLAALDDVARATPGVPVVACFDTAFHATLPPAAATYAVPVQWRERWGIRRYGFHGLSHAWVAQRAAAWLGGEREALRIVSAHLGAGASLCAIRDGRSVDTTMGFTPLEGLVMATRSGSVDPGLVLWLQDSAGMSAPELAAALEHESGLLGLGGSADMRTIVERADAGDPAARLALDVYVHRLKAGVAAMAAALGGIDALVFTGGVGEHSARVRALAAAGLGFLGVEVDTAGNETATPDADISASGAGVHTLIVAAREDLVMAAQARALLSPAA